MRHLEENAKRKQTSDGTLQYYLNLSYPIEIVEEDGAFVASIPDLPGCNAFGEDLTSAIDSLKETKELWLRGRIDAAQPIPEPSITEGFSGKFVLRIPKSLHRALDREAKREGTSLNQYVNCLLSARHENHIIEQAIKRSQRSQNDRLIQKATTREWHSGGLNERFRTQSGEIRSVRSDTRVAALRETYGSQFAPGYRGDTRLGTLLEREGVTSLSDYIKKKK